MFSYGHPSHSPAGACIMYQGWLSPLPQWPGFRSSVGPLLSSLSFPCFSCRSITIKESRNAGKKVFSLFCNLTLIAWCSVSRRQNVTWSWVRSKLRSVSWWSMHTPPPHCPDLKSCKPQREFYQKRFQWRAEASYRLSAVCGCFPMLLKIKKQRETLFVCYLANWTSMTTCCLLYVNCQHYLCLAIERTVMFLTTFFCEKTAAIGKLW